MEHVRDFTSQQGPDAEPVWSSASGDIPASLCGVQDLKLSELLKYTHLFLHQAFVKHSTTSHPNRPLSCAQQLSTSTGRCLSN